MFEARLVNGIVFKQLIDAISGLVENVNVEASDEELAIQCLDSAHVSLVSISLSSMAFDHYRCDRSLTLGFNTPNMTKVLKMMGNDDVLVLKAEDQPEELEMMFDNEKTGTVADFQLKLMDITTEQHVIPDTTYKCTVQMPASEFQRIIRDLQAVGDTCRIACTKEGVRFSTTGSIGTANVLVRANSSSDKEEENVVIDMEEPVEFDLALRYLNFFTKATPLSKKVILNLSPDIPFVVEYPIDQIGHVKYFLAPKVEEEDEDMAG